MQYSNCKKSESWNSFLCWHLNYAEISPWRWQSSALLRRVVWYKFTDVRKVLAASIVKVISTSVNFCQTAWRNNPEHSHLHTRCSEDLESPNTTFITWLSLRSTHTNYQGYTQHRQQDTHVVKQPSHTRYLFVCLIKRKQTWSLRWRFEPRTFATRSIRVTTAATCSMPVTLVPTHQMPWMTSAGTKSTAADEKQSATTARQGHWEPRYMLECAVVMRPTVAQEGGPHCAWMGRQQQVAQPARLKGVCVCVCDPIAAHAQTCQHSSFAG
jgi:hypothetical protein